MHPPIHPVSIPAYPILGCGGAGDHPSGHWAGGRIYPGQVARLSHGRFNAVFQYLQHTLQTLNGC